MIITLQPVVTITIMSMLSISAWMTKSSWVWGTNIGKLSKINELHFTWAITIAAKSDKGQLCHQDSFWCIYERVISTNQIYIRDCIEEFLSKGGYQSWGSEYIYGLPLNLEEVFWCCWGQFTTYAVSDYYWSMQVYCLGTPMIFTEDGFDDEFSCQKLCELCIAWTLLKTLFELNFSGACFLLSLVRRSVPICHWH